MTTTTHQIEVDRAARGRPILHWAKPDKSGALCGAPVLGVIVYGQVVECVVCADLKQPTPPTRWGRLKRWLGKG